MELLKVEIEAVKSRLDEAEKDLKCNNKRIETLDKELIEMKVESNKDIKQLFRLLDRIDKNTEKINKEVEKLKFKPAKKWDNATWLVITAIISSAITYFIQIGGF